MKNKQLFQFRFLSLAVFLFILFLIPNTHAAYDCAYNVTDPSTCCYDGETGYQGVYCNPGEYIQKLGSSSPVCKTEAQILSRASTANSKLFVGFNCFNDQLNSTCQNPLTQCYNPSTQACQTFGGPNATCEAADKITNCDGSCGSCKSGFISCGGECQVPATGSCGDGYSLNQCTGSCSCPSGTTPSGVYDNECVSYFNRFAEILDFGLARLGGLNKNGVYDYSETALTTYASSLDPESIQTYISGIYLKSDVAETLNWNSDTLPPAIQDLITNNGNNTYILCDAVTPCPGSMTCSEGGLCYTDGAGVVDSCATNGVSDCDLGLACNANNICALPGDSSFDNSYFVGFTAPNAFATAIAGGYTAANAKCNTAYSGSHVCTVDEMLAISNINPDNLSGVTGEGWINGGPPGYKANANDCKAWKSKGDSYYGRYWDFNTSEGWMRRCTLTNTPFACCK